LQYLPHEAHSRRMKGFVDLQVNGFIGIDFSRVGLTLEDISKVVSELLSRGTTAFCPTMITSSPDAYRSNLPVLARACRHPELGERLLGIHLEGPFISPVDGARGAHSRDAVRLPDCDLLDRLWEWSEGQIRLLTLAPELPGAIELIERAVSLGIRISLGHHLADAQAIEAAVRAGAVASTHFGNGIPNLVPRHDNPLWPQLAADSLSAMLITDGHHLPPSFIAAVIKAKGADGVIVVSDAAPIAGFQPGEHRTLGQQVVLEVSGRLWNPVGRHLVGSSASMLDCMNHLAGLNLLTGSQLRQVGRDNPLRLIGADSGGQAESPEVRFESGRFVLN